MKRCPSDYCKLVTYTTSFEKQLDSSSHHPLRFCPNLVQEYVSEGIFHPAFYGDLVNMNKQRNVKGAQNVVSSDSKIVERL